MNIFAVVVTLLIVVLAAVGVTFLGLYLTKRVKPPSHASEEQEVASKILPRISPVPHPASRPIITYVPERKMDYTPAPTTNPTTPESQPVSTSPEVESDVTPPKGDEPTTPKETQTEQPAGAPSRPTGSDGPLPSLRKESSASLNFDLASRGSFLFGNDFLNVEAKSEFTMKFDSYLYSLDNKTFTPEKFIILGEEQSGLPLKAFDSIKVYLSHGISRTPLVVVLSYEGKKEYYNYNFNNTWSLTSGLNLEEFLDFLDCYSNNEIVINLSRRSDYHRNGSGDSKFELTKDVNVYVETDQPALGWNTYRHKLMLNEKDLKAFYPIKFTFDNKVMNIPITTKCEYIDVYYEFDNTKTPPPILYFKHKNSEMFYVFEDNRYTYNPEGSDRITHQNLAAKLVELSKKSKKSKSSDESVESNQPGVSNSSNGSNVPNQSNTSVVSGDSNQPHQQPQPDSQTQQPQLPLNFQLNPLPISQSQTQPGSSETQQPQSQP